MQLHALEFSQTLIPSFSVDVSDGKHSNQLSDFELSMMCGVSTQHKIGVLSNH